MFFFLWRNTRLCHRWSARPTGSWTQMIHWRLTPTLPSRLRQRWRWSTRRSRCHTAATPLLFVHLSLLLFPSLPLSASLSLSLFAMLWNCEAPPKNPAQPTQLSSCFCLAYLLSACVGSWAQFHFIPCPNYIALPLCYLCTYTIRRKVSSFLLR